MGLALTLFLLLISLVALRSVLHHLRLRKKLRGIQQPRSLPFFGHSLIVKPDHEGFMDQFIGMATLFPNEPRMVVMWAGPIPLVMIYGPEIAEKVFSNPAHMAKSFTYDFLKPWLGNGLLTVTMQEWKPRRKLLTPTFHYDILRNFFHVFNKQAFILIEELKGRTNKDPTITDIFEPLSMCALDIICETSMGQSVNAQTQSNSEYVRAVLLLNRLVQVRQKNPLLFADFIYGCTKDGREAKWALNVLHTFTKKVIADRRKALKMQVHVDFERLAFLDLLLEMENRGEITEDITQNEVDTFMFEGHDTTSTGLTWTLHLLACHPEIQNKALEEINRVVGDAEEITQDHLGELKYVECVLKESLRIFPSVPMIARKLGADLDINGELIPSGTQVILNIFLIHRDPRNWDEPEMFKPERFLSEYTKKRHAFSYVPFSAGGRNCIGQRFALMEEKILLCWLLRTFEIRSPRRRDQQNFQTELILRPTDSVPIILLPRTNGSGR